jgi:hypothetical protein
MRTCIGCQHADWRKTANGRLHPSGDGQCRYEYKVPALPQSMYWIGRAPEPSGRHISRKDELKDHCAYYLRA